MGTYFSTLSLKQNSGNSKYSDSSVPVKSSYLRAAKTDNNKGKLKKKKVNKNMIGLPSNFKVFLLIVFESIDHSTLLTGVQVLC